MREIKLRAWQDDEMIYQKYSGVQAALEFFKKLYYDNYDIMQYTGLKDKNGKEIYEGDIVKFSDSDIIYEIIFENESFIAFNKRRMIFKVIRNGFMKKTDCKIIGNVYENLELLGELR